MKHKYLTRKDFNVSSNIYNLSNIDPEERKKIKTDISNKISKTNKKKKLKDNGSFFLPFYIQTPNFTNLLLGEHIFSGFEFRYYYMFQIFLESLGLMRFNNSGNYLSDPVLIKDMFSKECIKNLQLNIKESKILMSPNLTNFNNNTKDYLEKLNKQQAIHLDNINNEERERHRPSFDWDISDPNVLGEKKKISTLKDLNFDKKPKDNIETYNGISTITVNFTYLELFIFLEKFVSDVTNWAPSFSTIKNFLNGNLRYRDERLNETELISIFVSLLLAVKESVTPSEIKSDLKGVIDILNYVYPISQLLSPSTVYNTNDSEYKKTIKNLNFLKDSKTFSLTFVFFIEDINYFINSKEYKSTSFRVNKDICTFNPFGVIYNSASKRYSFKIINNKKLFLNTEKEKANYSVNYFGNSIKSTIILQNNIRDFVFSTPKPTENEFYFSNENDPGITIKTFKEKINQIDSKLTSFYKLESTDTTLYNDFFKELIELRRYLTLSYFNENSKNALLILLFDFPSLTNEIYNKLLLKFKDNLIENNETTENIKKILWILISIRHFSKINNVVENRLSHPSRSSQLKKTRNVIYEQVKNFELDNIYNLIEEHYRYVNGSCLDCYVSSYMYVDKIETIINDLDIIENTKTFLHEIENGFTIGISEVYNILSNKVVLSKLIEIKEAMEQEKQDIFVTSIKDFRRIVSRLIISRSRELEELYLISDDKANILGEILTLKSLYYYFSHSKHDKFSKSVVLKQPLGQKSYVDKKTFTNYFTNQLQLFPVLNV